jgi:type I restriction enzyme S subunit
MAKKLEEIKEEECPYELPEGWKWERLGNVADVKGGKRLPKGHKLIENKTKHPYIRVADFGIDTVNLDNIKYIEEDTYTQISKYTISKNDMYISIAGTIGKVGIIPNILDGANLTENAAKISNINDCISLRYLVNLFKTEDTKLQINANTKTTTQAKLALFRIENILLPLPPKETQQKIVDIIELLFAKLDIAQEKVEQVLAESENRRSAILHNAFSGKLTEKWREENNVSFDSWLNCQLKEVCEVNPKKINTNDKDDEIDVSFIPMTVVSDVYGNITEHQMKKLKEVKKGYTNFINGDVIFAKITPCMENGKSAIVSNLINDIGYGSTEFYVIRCSDKISNNFVYHLVRWSKFREEAKTNMKGAVGQQRVPKNFIEEYNITLPKISEQKEIVRLLDKFLSVEDKVKSTCQNTLEAIATMRKSILAKAFRGELSS